MSTNKEVLNKGIKYLLYALPLFFIGPSVIFSSFKNQGNVLYYPILSLGIIGCLAAMYLMFKGIQTIMKSLFDGNN